jgi:hypothetical protein
VVWDRSADVSLLTDVSGAPRRIAARQGVLLATGGFSSNAEMARDYLRLPVGITLSSPAVTGAGTRWRRKREHRRGTWTTSWANSDKVPEFASGFEVSFPNQGWKTRWL